MVRIHSSAVHADSQTYRARQAMGRGNLAARSQVIAAGRWETGGWPSIGYLARAAGPRTDSSLAHAQTVPHHFIDSIPLVQSPYL